ncbi:MAG: DnaA regulatory inactivator Hda [Spongiibacteraceae bacterium]|nr:DnaA regulatory inactivator Hda [Spongiibacteraceae bacterium]
MPEWRQLPLGFRFPEGKTFASFVTVPANEATVATLERWVNSATPGVFFLAGPAHSGRTHLLQAAAAQRLARDGGARVWLLPLAELAEAGLDPVEVTDGLEQAELLCLDDIDAVVTDSAWCEALFHLFNRLQQRGGQLLVSATMAPAALPCRLPDLQSRLGWGGCYRLEPLDDAGRHALLTELATRRGLQLAEGVPSYILTRFSRDSADLVNLVEKLDNFSLVTKRRITIALVRQLADSSIDGASS